MKDPIYGFSLLRNGLKYDYCFVECLESLSNVTRKTYLALGKGEDETEKEILKLPYIDIIPTVWDENLREGGLILSEQTNIALKRLKENHSLEEGAWGVYLQCDEVFHEDDYQLIIEDIKKAEKAGHDAMTFRYLHFWQSHNDIAINKKWYPQEIRAIKLNGNIESWGDAQSFKNFNNLYHSEARIYHYGHVRESDKYKNKKADIMLLYHEDEKLSKYKKREKKYDDQTEVLAFHGTHPRLMMNRIKRIGLLESKNDLQEAIWIVDQKQALSKSFIDKIKVREVHYVNSLSEVPKEKRKKTIILWPNWWQRILYPSRVPLKMKSKLSHLWNFEFYAMLKISEKGIEIDY